MLKKIKRALITEKIPTIVCVAACLVSVLMGFVMGYMFTVQGEYSLVYAEAPMPYVAAANPEPYTPSSTPPPQYVPPVLEAITPSHLYVVTTTNGYLAIYHAEKNGGGLKELTTTTVCTLSPEEQELLAKGIRIYSEEALARLLQDYGS